MTDTPDPRVILLEGELGRVRRALEALPERCRALLDLLYYAADAPSYERVSERLGMPVGSIGPTRARCLEKLARRFAELESEAQ